MPNSIALASALSVAVTVAALDRGVKRWRRAGVMRHALRSGEVGQSRDALGPARFAARHAIDWRKRCRLWIAGFGFTPEVYSNNLGLMKVDPAAVDALILSHGHFDHYSGLIGFLEAQRAQMRKDLRLYASGEDDFCHRLFRNPDGSLADFGTLDRSKLRALNVEPVLSEVPIVIEGHAFTTGIVPRTSIEHVLPQTWVAIGIKDGLGCDR
jgi:glyoxylase-like metal-dependent hydrolase (beta-lactamase superfamily II)